MNSLDQIIKAIKQHIHTLYPGISLTHDIVLNIDPQRQQFGDLSCNAPLIYAKELKQQPRFIAQYIIRDLKNPFIKNIEIAGAGFINVSLTDSFFKKILHERATQGEQFYLPASSTPLPAVNIEFVSANPTGPLHLGHGRGGIIGDVLGTILRFLGYDVTKEFYINDAGNQIKTLGASFKIRCLHELGRTAELPEQGYHGDYLKELAQQAYADYGTLLADKPDSFFADYAQAHLLAHIRTTLETYGIIFDVWFSEKQLHESGAISRALQKLQASGHLYEKDGALWFASTSFGDDKDRVIRRADGELTYVSADIAYLEDKLTRKANKLIMVLGQDHHSYVIRLKSVLQALGKNPALLDVILYQLVTIKESGQTMRLSKRAGRIISLEDIIETVGKDVARFFYLHRKADAHLEFDITLALSHTEENPVYYIQYAYVRTLSILDKASAHDALTQIKSDDLEYLSAKEELIIKKIVSLGPLLHDIARHYQTHLLTYYVYDLAHFFHAYYGSTKVIDLNSIPITRARLYMVMQLRDTLNLCLRLLGISTPARM